MSQLTDRLAEVQPYWEAYWRGDVPMVVSAVPTRSAIAFSSRHGAHCVTSRWRKWERNSWAGRGPTTLRAVRSQDMPSR